MLCLGQLWVDCYLIPIKGGLIPSGKSFFFYSYLYLLPCVIIALVPLSASIFTAIYMKEVSLSYIS